VGGGGAKAWQSREQPLGAAGAGSATRDAPSEGTRDAPSEGTRDTPQVKALRAHRETALGAPPPLNFPRSSVRATADGGAQRPLGAETERCRSLLCPRVLTSYHKHTDGAPAGELQTGEVQQETPARAGER